ncbi:MAG TPA: FecR domain-containing protein, partial [Chryseosolibacter sp.]|nr:FecR domain-containing protein [Chryseosolibacter sp.]
LKENPEKSEAIEEARNMILAVVQENHFHSPDGKQNDIWKRIQASTEIEQAKERSLWQHWYTKAAVVLVLLGGGWFLYDYEKPAQQVVAVADAGPRFVKQINNSENPKTIILSDGTSIILQPHSVLEYPAIFEADKREVFLTGQGFFEVVRDPQRPFLVQAGEIVTRVLGTSFTVRNVEGEENVLVKVETGKVSVFMATEKPNSAQHNKTIEGVVLTPNQQVVYERGEMKMTKSLVENPSVLIPIAKHKFEFVDAPIKDVFATIEEAYGVEIVFDEEALSSCFLNASLTDVPLYEKLKLICMGINTTYEIIDSHIIIYGSGCDENSEDM